MCSLLFGVCSVSHSFLIDCLSYSLSLSIRSRYFFPIYCGVFDSISIFIQYIWCHFFHESFGISGPNYTLYAYRQTCSSSSSSLFTSFSRLLVGISCLLLFQLIPPSSLPNTMALYKINLSIPSSPVHSPRFFPLPQSVDKHVITMLHKYANFEIHTSFYPGILSLYSLSFSVVQHIKSIPLYLIPRQMIFVIHTTHKTEIWENVDPFRHISPHLLSDRTWLWSCVQTTRHHCHHQFIIIIIIIIISANVVWINTRGGKKGRYYNVYTLL